MQYTMLIYAENDVSRASDGTRPYSLVEFRTRAAVGVFGLRMESFSESGGLTIAWRLAEDNASVQLFQVTNRENLGFNVCTLQVQSEVNGRTTVMETQNAYYTFTSIDPTVQYTFKVRLVVSSC